MREIPGGAEGRCHSGLLTRISLPKKSNPCHQFAWKVHRQISCPLSIYVLKLAEQDSNKLVVHYCVTTNK